MFRVFKKKTEEDAVVTADPEPSVSASAVAEASAPVESVSVPASPAGDSAPRSQPTDLFRSLLSGMYDAVLIVDDKGYLIQSNDRAREFFGYGEGELWNINCSQLIPKLNAQVLYKIWSHIRQSRFTVVNAICKRKDGSVFPGEIAISSMQMNFSTTMVLAIRNVERRNKTQHVNRIRDKVLKYAGVGIVSCKPDGTIEYANAAFQKLVHATGMPEVLAVNISDFFKHADQCRALLETPTKVSSWSGTIELTTMSNQKIKVQATSARAEAQSTKGVDYSLVMTFSLLPVATVSAAK